MSEQEFELRPPLWEKILHLPYLLLYGLVKYVPSPYGFFLRWPVLKMFGLGGGWGHVYEGVTIHYPWRVSLDTGWSLNEAVYIVPGGKIRIGKNTRIAARVVLVATNHSYQDRTRPVADQGFINAPIFLGDDVWIGVNSVVLAGVSIGRGTVVGASSVVNRSTEENAIVAGNPAALIGYR
tara:strand:+ start:637 stop:1176 length:540 start_codon:yes stop_codon:yes gene_type:complete